MTSIADGPIQTEEALTSVIFTVSDRVGALGDALALIRARELNMTRIESRPSRVSANEYDFFVDFKGASPADIDALIDKLKEQRLTTNAQRLAAEKAKAKAAAEGDDEKSERSEQVSDRGVVSSGSNGSLESAPLLSAGTSISAVPWFPRKIGDLDSFAHKTLDCGEELAADHPGFTDDEYRRRREEIVAIAKTYRHGEKIPRVEYTKSEIETWGTVYRQLKVLYPTHACKQLNYVFPLLEANCGYAPDCIPQLQDVSEFLKECTGFSLRPVTGLLSARDFLNGLAFRVFHSTQYIRHHTKPLYTPEPDVCHELMGHIPLFCDPDFADFSQEIGLASLGASDDDIEKLATTYWFTVEFGLCMEGSERKAYGAGLLSSFGELQYCLGGDPDQKPQYAEFIPEITAETQYPITSYQPLYYVADSFAGAKEKMAKFSSKLTRPFAVRYNALTQSVEVIDRRSSLKRFVSEIEAQLKTLSHSIDSIPGLKD